MAAAPVRLPYDYTLLFIAVISLITDGLAQPPGMALLI